MRRAFLAILFPFLTKKDLKESKRREEKRIYVKNKCFVHKSSFFLGTLNRMFKKADFGCS